MTDLITSVSRATTKAHAAKPEAIFFDAGRHHFKAIQGLDIDKAAQGFTSLLSVIIQVTRRCNFNCSFCSEIVQMPDPTLEELDLMRQHLQGVQRVFLFGRQKTKAIHCLSTRPVKRMHGLCTMQRTR